MMNEFYELNPGETFSENEWEIYVFPKVEEIEVGDAIVFANMSAAELRENLESGKRVLLS